MRSADNAQKFYYPAYLNLSPPQVQLRYRTRQKSAPVTAKRLWRTQNQRMFKLHSFYIPMAYLQIRTVTAGLTRPSFPPVRACLFDMDGLILDTEDKYSECVNVVLSRYSKPPMPWSIKAKLQGRPAPESVRLFSAWAQLPISTEEYQAQIAVLQRELFPKSQPLPGVETLFSKLRGARTTNSDRVSYALATSSHGKNFKLKSAHLGPLFTIFDEDKRVLGDDPRIPKGRGKPAPDIYLLALKTINDGLEEGEQKISPEECLVFEDSVPGVEAGRRAGMRVIWVPHPGLYEEFKDRIEEVLAGRTGEMGDVDLHQLGEVGDGWGEYLKSLETFNYDKYGIVV